MCSTSTDTMMVEQLPFELCPHCGDDRFTTHAAGGAVIFDCGGCGQSWRYLLGYLVSSCDDPIVNHRRPG